MIEFKITPVKHKPSIIKPRARKGADIKKDIKTCYDCPECRLTEEYEDGYRRYKCGFTPDATRLIPKVMNRCEYMNKPNVPLKADYIQRAYADSKRWKK